MFFIETYVTLFFQKLKYKLLLHYHHVCEKKFFNDTATTEIYTHLDTLSLHDALPISVSAHSKAVIRLSTESGDNAGKNM